MPLTKAGEPKVDQDKFLSESLRTCRSGDDRQTVDQKMMGKYKLQNSTNSPVDGAHTQINGSNLTGGSKVYTHRYDFYAYEMVNYDFKELQDLGQVKFIDSSNHTVSHVR